MRIAIWFAPFLLAAVLLSACDGDDGPAGPTLPFGRSAAPTAPDDAGPAPALAAKFLAGVDGKYVYRYTGPGDVGDSVLTVYRLGVNDRQDVTNDKFGFDATTATIFATEDNFVCTIAGSTNNCLVAGVAELEALRIISSPIYDGLVALVTEYEMFEIDELASETRAGIRGDCYRAVSETRIGQGAPSSEDIKACFTDQGVVLSFERTITPDSPSILPTTYAIELQEAAEAKPSDFEPTAPVVP
ncbi:MAG TPA: hypothetical protein VFP63_05515 [Dehalococcoidia bacterium]|nr:hypothetical protein [Dehalococcoidia bacterium]